MPNFIIEYSEPLSQQIDPEILMDKVFTGAKNCGHFPSEAIKLRTQSRTGFRLHGKQQDFLHISGHILSGRTDEQKTEISHAIMAQLKDLGLSSVFVSVEIVDIHRSSFVDFEY